MRPVEKRLLATQVFAIKAYEKININQEKNQKGSVDVNETKDGDNKAFNMDN